MTPPKKVLNAAGQTRWEIRAEIKVGAKRQQIRRQFLTEKAAKIELARISHEQNEGEYVHRDPNMTIRKLIELAAEAKRTAHKDNTSLFYETIFKSLLDRHGDLPVMDLTDRHLIKLRDDMLNGKLRRIGTPGKPLSPSTVNQTLGAITGLLEFGKHKRVLMHNVANPLSVPRVSDHEVDDDSDSFGEARRSAWNDGQLAKFRIATADEPLCGSWALTAQGLRRGEVLGLKWDDIDWEASTVTVRRTRVYVNGIDRTTTPKSKKSRRTLTMGPAVMEALQRQRARQDRDLNYENWVTVDPAGRPIRTEVYSDTFGRLVAAAGLPSLTLHGARHAVATALKHGGAELPDIAKRLGQDQGSLATTLGYIHSSAKGDEKIREILGN